MDPMDGMDVMDVETGVEGGDVGTGVVLGVGAIFGHRTFWK
jgi:hypothetical protein